jgi:predicted membrane metal-binding protein
MNQRRFGLPKTAGGWWTMGLCAAAVILLVSLHLWLNLGLLLSYLLIMGVIVVGVVLRALR